MKNFLLFFILLSVLLVSPLTATGQLVPCGNQNQTACTLTDFFVLIANVYSFIVWNIATPLATLMIVIGGILMLLAGINANWYNTGKTMVKMSIIAILLIWSAVLIIDTIFQAIGYTGSWNAFP